MSDRLRTVGVDVLLVVALVAAMLVELQVSDDPDTKITPLSVTVVVLAALPVLLRRTRPGLALILGMTALYLVMIVVNIYQTVPFPSMIAGYSLALVSDRRRTLLAGLALVPVVVLAIAIFGHELLASPDLVKNLVFVAAPLLLGSAVRERRAAHAALVERAETAEQTREEEARRRVGEERLRIARDVHDVVAHAMVAINVQAGVGAHLLERDPEQARHVLDDIKRVSGEALTDLRGTLGDLRAPGDEKAAAPVQPAQGLGELEDLADGTRSAGVHVTVVVEPTSGTVPAPLAATAYRIVQEGLTNVVRHASASRATVRVTCAPGQLIVEVADDGGAVDPRPGTAPDGTGNGLRGMRERAWAAGGTLVAGPLAEGGWRVRATLPVASPVEAP